MRPADAPPRRRSLARSGSYSILPGSPRRLVLKPRQSSSSCSPRRAAAAAAATGARYVPGVRRRGRGGPVCRAASSGRSLPSLHTARLPPPSPLTSPSDRSLTSLSSPRVPASPPADSRPASPLEGAGDARYVGGRPGRRLGSVEDLLDEAEQEWRELTADRWLPLLWCRPPPRQLTPV